MNSFTIIALIFTVFLYSTTQGLQCDQTNPCGYDMTYNPDNGYQCFNEDAFNVICTCPNGGIERNMPCRLCARTNPLSNVCRNSTGRLIMCLEDKSYVGGFACLCSNGFGSADLTTSAECDLAVTVTARPTTTTTTLVSSITSACVNGGIYANGVCNCPSGFIGPNCAEKSDANLCDKVYCLNNGVCAIRNTAGPYQAVCLCRYGTYGEYCELTGTMGFCTTGLCLNGGACIENVVSTTRHAYCNCPAGFNGPKCETRYFTCPAAGSFADPVMFNQGKYFVCTNINGAFQLTQKSCPKGLRFNANVQGCTY
jgi:hypothetical protein